MILHLLQFKRTTNTQKPALFFFKMIAHNFGKENKPNNAEILSWLMGLGPILLS